MEQRTDISASVADCIEQARAADRNHNRAKVRYEAAKAEFLEADEDQSNAYDEAWAARLRLYAAALEPLERLEDWNPPYIKEFRSP
jgi:hypothetical protein